MIVIVLDNIKNASTSVLNVESVEKLPAWSPNGVLYT